MWDLDTSVSYKKIHRLLKSTLKKKHLKEEILRSYEIYEKTQTQRYT